MPRPVDRLEFISGRVRGRSVFDLGALDETAMQAKQGTRHWLHAALCATASSVVGVDNSPLLPAQGIDTPNGGRIVHADIFDLAPLVESHGRPDVVVAGELIEHLPDTSGFLRSLTESGSLAGCELVFSTPNACCWHNFVVGLAGRESTHKDHLQIYSYKTLRTLFDRAGVALTELVPYRVSFQEMISASGRVGKLGVRIAERTVNALEWATPTLSAGWIGVAGL